MHGVVDETVMSPDGRSLTPEPDSAARNRAGARHGCLILATYQPASVDVLFNVAVALRNALDALLGLQTNELGCEVQEARATNDVVIK